MRIEAVVCAVLACALVVGCGGDESFDAELAPTDRVAASDDDAAVELRVESPAPDAGAPASDAAQPMPAPADASTSDAQVADAPDAGPALEQPARPPCVVALHRDADADGYGARGVSMVACDSTSGYVVDGTDCYDGNALARPVAMVGGVDVDRGDGSFDYDCDGVETPLRTEVSTCPTFDASAVHCPPPGWRLPYVDGDLYGDCYETLVRAKADPLSDGWWQTVPACGQTGLRGFTISYTRETSYTCAAPTGPTDQIQTCR